MIRADKADAGASGGTQFWSGAEDHCSIPGCTATVVTTTIPVTVTVQDSGGSPEAGLKVYAFDGTHYTGYNKTSDASGQATFTLPQGDYRFRADKNGVQYWSDTVNHCPVPGCTTATVTTSGQAMRLPAGERALALADPGLLLMLPLAAAALLNRKKKGRRWSWPVTCALLVVAVMGVGASLVEASGPAVGTPVDNVALS